MQRRTRVLALLVAPLVLGYGSAGGSNDAGAASAPDVPREETCDGPGCGSGGCQTDGDCAAPMPLCEPISSTCVPCLTGADCASIGQAHCLEETHDCSDCRVDDDSNGNPGWFQFDELERIPVP